MKMSFDPAIYKAPSFHLHNIV